MKQSFVQIMAFDSQTANFILALILAAMSFLWPRLPFSNRVFIEIIMRRILFPWNSLYRNVWTVYLDAWFYRRTQASEASYLGSVQFHALWNSGAYSRLEGSPAGILYTSIIDGHLSVNVDVEWLRISLVPDLMLILERDRQYLEKADFASVRSPASTSDVSGHSLPSDSQV